MRQSLAIHAPAKLNLALSVGTPNAQGMHPICSWMVTVNLFDDLLVTRLEDDRLSRYAILWHADAKRRSDINWSITRDLAVRAHLALEQHAGHPLPVQLKLEKRIPVGGGLGGGSSDAAAMLRAVNELFGLGLSLEELAAVGASLGSDVPFLVRGGSAIVQGIGDQITHHEDVPSLHAVIAFPQASCPTARVYGHFDESLPQRNGAAIRADAVAALVRNAVQGSLNSEMLFNDLARPAIKSAPQLEDDLASLSALAERPAHVTGSGSSLFVMCDNQVHAMTLADAVERTLHLPAVAAQTCSVPHHAPV